MKWIQRAEDHRDRVAVVDSTGQATYGDVIDAAGIIANFLLQGGDDLDGARVALMATPGAGFISALWGIWRAGGIAVPLCLSHPLPELEHVLSDSGASRALVDARFETFLAPLSRDLDIPQQQLEAIPKTASPSPLPEITADHRATLVYTSGTTGKPKGVVATQGNLHAQVSTLHASWGWSHRDHILNVLPLHHVHGLVNVQACALWSGATWETLERFDAEAVWERLASGEITLFMAVPTIYHRLIQAWEKQDLDTRSRLSEGVGGLRLMVSGSAALPVQVLESWEEISGHVLLERYGMTEIGMALSNPLEGLRKPGFVGQPLPGVEVKLVDEQEQPVPEGQSGELRVRGPSVFREYWNRPEETRKAFRDGWFITGDVAQQAEGSYRILGRSSVDIIKTGGFKVSALEVEAVLRDHPHIQDCAVVGLPDREWGQIIAAALVLEETLVLEENSDLTAEALRQWAQQRLAPYKLPRRILPLEELPRNALGKVVKPRVSALFASVSQDEATVP